MKTAVAGRTLLTAVAAFTTVGGFLMDWNKTHLFNANWPPHAKLHDSMTILLGTLLGGSSLYLLQKKDGNQAAQNLKAAALLPAFFYLAQVGSFGFPGAEGMDAEFPEKIPSVGRLRLNEGPFSLVMLAAISAGYLLARKGNS
ncbi:DUF6640 family protein [Rufibacter glacialis]|uniref:DUF6640 family protein n=1 Tax=Rufibacter glacialis TaxID=1259555 RepID=A0A5M8Q8R2_9BACT|nr:DUF6640 family protein [Rufibacter glacialis]KAA6432259.1 hypothetical protein FOE74_14190 [Rufibacter glacialis]GGK77192.1 hypothetical protein GCM10011405_26230 [Rufibacter glacialis]